MSGSSARIVHVGTPPSDFEAWATTEVCFHKFADLPMTKDEGVDSEFTCFDHIWKVEIYPGGEGGSDEGNVAVDLSHMSVDGGISVTYFISVRDSTGKEVSHGEPSGPKQFDPYNEEEFMADSCTFIDFAKYSTMIDALVDGTLIIEVRMRLKEIKSTKQFIPENPMCSNILEKFNDEESADIVFEVGIGEKQTNGKRKKAKTSTTNFYAHRFIVQDVSPTLAEMCKCKPGGDAVTSVPITDVKPDVFEHILYYMYGGENSDEELEADAKDIIEACDKYGVGLKLEAEVCYVKSITITVDNMIDNLLYADSKNLALLKEAVMDHIVANKNSIIGKVSFDTVPGSMMADLLTAMARVDQNEEEVGDSESIKYNKMRVSELRKWLANKGLEVDGSREAMLSLLKENL